MVPPGPPPQYRHCAQQSPMPSQAALPNIKDINQMSFKIPPLVHKYVQQPSADQSAHDQPNHQLV